MHDGSPTRDRTRASALKAPNPNHQATRELPKENISYSSSHLFFILVRIRWDSIILFLFFFFGCVGSSLLQAGFLQLWQAGATLRCGAQASHCGGFSCCGAWALGSQGSVVVAYGLQSAGSVVVAHGFSCFVECGIFLDQESNLCPLHQQADSQPQHHQGSPNYIFFNLLFFISEKERERERRFPPKLDIKSSMFQNFRVQFIMLSKVCARHTTKALFLSAPSNLPQGQKKKKKIPSIIAFISP